MNSWVNGRAGNAIGIADRGLLYGDGLFETMRVRRHVIRLLPYHLERLADGCRRLAIGPPDIHRLQRELTGIASRRRDAVVKLIVTRGAGTRGYRPSGREHGSRIITLHPLPRKAIQATRLPVRIRVCEGRLGCNETLAGLKTLNRLDSVLARAEWADAGVWEGLMRDSDDNIVCGTMSNVFVRRGVSLITPRLDRCGIAGVMRRWVLEQAHTQGLRVVEGRLRWRDLTRIDEAFMTNAVVGIVPVAVIGQGRARIRLAQHASAMALRRRLELQ